MEILFSIKTFTDKSRIGDVFVNDQVECHSLEDADRGLTDDMTLEQIAAIKVYGETAIPYGRYELAVTWSNRFKMFMPLLLNVKGFDGVRIHSGNTAEQSTGCILVGKDIPSVPDMILNSKEAFNALFSKIKEAISKEKVFVTIQKAQTV